MFISLLKKLIDKVKSGSSGPLTTDEIMLPVEGSSINPQGGPIGTGISMAHRDQRQMLAGGSQPDLFWATGGEQYEDKVLDLEKPIKTISTQRNEDDQVMLDRIAVNTDKTLFKAYVTKDDEKFKYIKTGDATTTVPLNITHAEHVATHIHNMAVTYTLGKVLDVVEKLQKARGKHWSQRDKKQEGGEIEEQMGELIPEEAPIPLETIEEPTETMLPDEEMEEDYVEFIMAEALEPEEQQYLSDKLVEDDQLSIIFDKVIETASEFSGSGSVEGPGSAVSDSIPARLSDGEFVMTAKATDALGADTLEELMALAEQEADVGRQTKAIGGEIENRIDTAPAVTEEDPLKQKQKEWMGLADPRRSLFSS